MEKAGSIFCSSPSPTQLECDGRLLLIEDYPDLFQAIGTVYGGDGEEHFKIPLIESGLDIMPFVILTVDEVEPEREEEDESFEDPDPLSVVSVLIQNAKLFSTTLMNTFIQENVVMGITQAGKTKEVADFLQKLQFYLGSGSLYAARTEIINLVDGGIPENLSPFITEERMNDYKSKIEDYLGF